MPPARLPLESKRAPSTINPLQRLSSRARAGGMVQLRFLGTGLTAESFSRARARTVAALLLCGVCASGHAATADAQRYPIRPVRIVVGFAAGGPTDVIARIIGQDLT